MTSAKDGLWKKNVSGEEFRMAALFMAIPLFSFQEVIFTSSVGCSMRRIDAASSLDEPKGVGWAEEELRSTKSGSEWQMKQIKKLTIAVAEGA